MSPFQADPQNEKSREWVKWAVSLWMGRKRQQPSPVISTAASARRMYQCWHIGFMRSYDNFKVKNISRGPKSSSWNPRMTGPWLWGKPNDGGRRRAAFGTIFEGYARWRGTENTHSWKTSLWKVLVQSTSASLYLRRCQCWSKHCVWAGAMNCSAFSQTF